jgi:hypothetical protein
MYTYVRQNPWTHFDPEGLDASSNTPPPPPPPPPPPVTHDKSSTSNTPTKSSDSKTTEAKTPTESAKKTSNNNSGATGALVGAGNELNLTGTLRAEYVKQIAALPPGTPKAVRDAITAAFQAKQTALGKAITKDVLDARKASGYEPSLSDISKTNEGVNAMAGNMKTLGRSMIGVGVGIEAYNVITAPAGQKSTVAAQASGRLGGGWGGAVAGAEVGSFAGPWGAAGGAIVGGFAGSKAGEAIVNKMGQLSQHMPNLSTQEYPSVP